MLDSTLVNLAVEVTNTQSYKVEDCLCYKIGEMPQYHELVDSLVHTIEVYAWTRGEIELTKILNYAVALSVEMGIHIGIEYQKQIKAKLAFEEILNGKLR